MTTDLPARILHFPSDRSAGTLHHTPNGLFGVGSHKLGEARGDVAVPAGAYVTLKIPATRSFDLSGLAQLRPDDLQNIVAAYVAVMDEDLQFVRGLTGLHRLVLTETDVTDDGLACVSGLNGLRELFIETMPITDAGIAHLLPLTGLEDLRLYQTRITGTSLAHIGRLTNLRRLTLAIESEQWGGAAVVLAPNEVAHLCALHRLEELTLSTTITDESLPHLATLTNLRRLSITGRRVTDAGLVHLQALTAVQSLHLVSTGITDDGLRRLRSMSNVQQLWLNNSLITDAGLAILAGNPNLRELFVRDTRVTDAGVVRFRAAMPACHIMRTKDEFLAAIRARRQTSPQDNDAPVTPDYIPSP